MAKRSRRSRRTEAPPAPRTPPERPSAAWTVLILVAAIAAAFLERILFSRAWGETGSLTSRFYYGDANRLVDYATAITQGRTFDNGIPFHPPGWPLLLAAVLRLTGAAHDQAMPVPITAVKLLLASSSALAVGMTAALAFEVAGLWAMVAVSLLGAFHFGHVVEGTVANSEALYGLCVAGFMWSSWRWLCERASQRRTRWAILTGVIGGAATLVRAEFVTAAVVLGVAAWRAGRERGVTTSRTIASRVLAGGVAAFAAAFVLMLTPTTVWHWRTLSAFNAAHVGQTGRSRLAGPLPTFAPVTSYGPFNFAMANHADADGGPNRDHPMLDRCDPETEASLSGGQLDLRCDAAYELYVSGYGIGAAWLVEEPRQAVKLMSRKIAYTIDFLAHGYLIDDVGAGVEGVRRRVDMLDPGAGWLLPIHIVLGIAGVMVLKRRPPALIVTLAPLVALSGSILGFYGYVRLGAAYMPVFWILQGAAAAAPASRFESARRLPPPKVISAAVVTMAIVLSYEFVRLDSPRTLHLDGPRDRAGRVVQDETVYLRR